MSYNRSLASLSDKSLLSRLHKLVTREKQTTLSVLEHLGEVDRRDLHLEYGFSSLFDYCVGDLGYSRSAAGRRIASARCIRRYPEMFDLLESGDVNLCTVGLVAPILDNANKDVIFREIRGKTQREVESIVASFKPPVAYRDRVRPVRVAVSNLGQNFKNRRNPLILNSRCGSSNRTNCGIVESSVQERLGPTSDTSVATEQTQFETASCKKSSTRVEKRLLIQFLANEAFMGKLDDVKSLLSNKIPGATFEEVFEAVIDEFIERHSPEARYERGRNAAQRSLKNQKRFDASEPRPRERSAKANAEPISRSPREKEGLSGTNDDRRTRDPQLSVRATHKNARDTSVRLYETPCSNATAGSALMSVPTAEDATRRGASKSITSNHSRGAVGTPKRT